MGENQSNDSCARDLCARLQLSLDWSTSAPFRGKRTNSISYACLETVHAKTVVPVKGVLVFCHLLGSPIENF